MGQDTKVKMGLEFNYEEYLEIDEYYKSLNIDWLHQRGI